MIVAYLLLATATPQVPDVTVTDLRERCVSGIAGDASKLASCQQFIRDTTAGLHVDLATSTCMAPARTSVDELTWTWIDWISANPPPDGARASDSVMAALLAKYPCGWEEG